MAKLFEANDYTDGTFSIVAHPTKGIVTRKDNGTMTCADAEKSVDAILEYAEKAKIVEMDKWSLYIEGVSEKLAREKNLIPISALRKAVANGFEATVEMGKYSTPRITLRPKGSTGKKAPKANKPKPTIIA